MFILVPGRRVGRSKLNLGADLGPKAEEGPEPFSSVKEGAASVTTHCTLTRCYLVFRVGVGFGHGNVFLLFISFLRVGFFTDGIFYEDIRCGAALLMHFVTSSLTFKERFLGSKEIGTRHSPVQSCTV